MSLNKINVRNWVLFLMVIAAVTYRFVQPGEQASWANFTPVGAIAMFAGTYFKNKFKAYLVPLSVLLLSDLLLTYTFTGQWNLFYEGFTMVYLSFAFMVFIGSLIRKVSIHTVLLGSLASVLVHWLLTDIQPWLYGTMYSKDLTGYIHALIAAIPFEKNLLIGNLVFGAILYGVFELAKYKFPALKTEKEIVY
jgi:hypothetical protein